MEHRQLSRRQLSLFEADQAELPFDAYVLPEPQPGEQLLLFEGRIPLVGEVETAFLDGDFREAMRAYARLHSTYPTDAAVAAFHFLLEIPDDLWEETRSDEERVSVWEHVVSRRRGTRDGFFRRWLRTTDGRNLAASHPAVAPDIANHLLSAGDRSTGRKVVRDVLIAGHELRPLAFDDLAVSDLLGEEGTPEWLASLGAIRHVWPRTIPDEAHTEALATALTVPLPEDECARALDFWFCLCVSGLGGRVPEEVRRNAHRRMKRLHPRFHEEFMTGRGG